MRLVPNVHRPLVNGQRRTEDRMSLQGGDMRLTSRRCPGGPILATQHALRNATVIAESGSQFCHGAMNLWPAVARQVASRTHGGRYQAI